MKTSGKRAARAAGAARPTAPKRNSGAGGKTAFHPRAAEKKLHAEVRPFHPRVAELPKDATFQQKQAALQEEILAARERRLANTLRCRTERRESAFKAFGDLCEMTEGLCVVPYRPPHKPRPSPPFDPLAHILTFLDNGVYFFYLSVWLFTHALTHRIARLRHCQVRAKYYEAERLRRQALAAERRRIRKPRTSNPCPTKEQILDAWLKVRDSDADLVRFGSRMEDLACYVDSSLIRLPDGPIIGRRGGIKAWLQENIPALALKYTAVMRCKAAARKLRQITQLPPPVPVERLVDATSSSPRTPDIPPHVLRRARAAYRAFAHPVARSRTAFLARIDAALDPDRVADAPPPLADPSPAAPPPRANEITMRRNLLEASPG